MPNPLKQPNPSLRRPQTPLSLRKHRLERRDFTLHDRKLLLRKRLAILKAELLAFRPNYDVEWSEPGSLPYDNLHPEYNYAQNITAENIDQKEARLVEAEEWFEQRRKQFLFWEMHVETRRQDDLDVKEVLALEKKAKEYGAEEYVKDRWVRISENLARGFAEWNRTGVMPKVE
ncbi:hypothetical protein BJ508DRAFT_328441 [Ascobolus immersus RN42]|uniref:Uncharacterized protein n=1 Tax=Ascobolus immersus RN42 TaxID=1160509 RepID=A0A3N4I1P9_ASCIM|nr:hypothetical protein BJ508DRAFT_328441 [Ascobolus immersus RN42]